MSSETRKILDEQIKNLFAPILRSDGFKGSGRTFRRVRNELIHVVNIQSSFGDKFAINLGVHLTFLPDSIGRIVDVKKITEPSCEFRRRMTISGADQWWNYKNNSDSIYKAVFDAAKVYENYGRQQFERLGNHPQDFAFVNVDYLKSSRFDCRGFWNTEVRHALTFARIRQHEGKFEESIELAKYGLEKIGQATGLKREFEKIISGNNFKQ